MFLQNYSANVDVFCSTVANVIGYNDSSIIKITNPVPNLEFRGSWLSFLESNEEKNINLNLREEILQLRTKQRGSSHRYISTREDVDSSKKLRTLENKNTMYFQNHVLNVLKNSNKLSSGKFYLSVICLYFFPRYLITKLKL